MFKNIISHLIYMLGNERGAIENFTTGWTETDPNGRLSPTATRSTWTNLTVNEDAFLSRNSAISLTGDFDIAFDMNIGASSGSLDQTLLGLYFTASGGNVEELYVNMGGAAESKVFVQLGFFSDPDELQDFDNTTLSQSTTYYARLKRDDDGGTGTGLITLDFYSTSSARATQTSPVLSLSIETPTQGDFDAMYAPLTYDGDDTITHNGYIENLNLAYAPVIVSVQPISLSLFVVPTDKIIVNIPSPVSLISAITTQIKRVTKPTVVNTSSLAVTSGILFPQVVTVSPLSAGFILTDIDKLLTVDTSPLSAELSVESNVVFPIVGFASAITMSLENMSVDKTITKQTDPISLESSLQSQDIYIIIFPGDLSLALVLNDVTSVGSSYDVTIDFPVLTLTLNLQDAEISAISTTRRRFTTKHEQRRKTIHRFR